MNIIMETVNLNNCVATECVCVFLCINGMFLFVYLNIMIHMVCKSFHSISISVIIIKKETNIMCVG